MKKEMKYKKAHLKDVSICPYCGARSLEGEEVNVGMADCAQEVNCHSCGGQFFDQYKIDDVYAD